MPRFRSKQEGVTGLGVTVAGKRYRFEFPYTTDDFTEMAILLDNGCEEFGTRAEKPARPLVEDVVAEEVKEDG